MRRLSWFQASIVLSVATALTGYVIAFVFVPAHQQMARDRAAILETLTELARRPLAPQVPAAAAPAPALAPELARPIAAPLQRDPSSHARKPPRSPRQPRRVLSLHHELDCADPNDPLCDEL